MSTDRRGKKRSGIVVLSLGLALLGLLALAPSSEVTGQAKSDPPATQAGSASTGDTIAFINAQIKKQWEENGISPSRQVADYEFLRRVYLDIIGRIPTIEEISNYNKRQAKNKNSAQSRAEEIEYLLTTQDYAENWANLWTAWLLTRTSQPGTDREAMRLWLEESFATNKAYDKVVEEILTATGKANESGPANFVLSHVGERVPKEDMQRDGVYEMVPVTSRTTRLFLGTQTQCTQCHDHPFIDSRKQGQFWGINAFFRQVERDEVGRRQAAGQFMALRDNLDNNSRGWIKYERRNGLLEMALPTYLDGKRIEPKANRRQELARLLTRDPMFAKAYVNRMWGHFFGRGFTNPVDDFGEHNPVSHPELLDRLARDFISSGHDQRKMIIWITNSLPYQLSSMPDEKKTNMKQDAEPYFARMLLKSMTPEQLVDSIFTATNADKTRATKAERRAMYDDWLRDFTVNFGDDEGNEATFNGTVVQALLLMNGPKLNEAIKAKPGSTVAKALNERSPAARLNHLYLAALTRLPTGNESKVAFGIGAKNPQTAWEDILWALLNSNEFILNH